MAALTADKERNWKGSNFETRSYAMTASTTIYKGSLVSITNATGLAIPAADTAATTFVGVALEQVVSGASIVSYIKVRTTGAVEVTLTSADAADTGQIMTVSDSDTVTDSTSTNDIQVGTLLEYSSATLGWVELGTRVAVAAT